MSHSNVGDIGDINGTLLASGDSSSSGRVLQGLWDLRLGHEHIIAHPIFSIVIFLSYYFLAVIPWMVLDLYCSHWNWVKRYKIQPDKEVTWPAVTKAMMLTAWNNVLYVLPATAAQWVWVDNLVLPTEAPPLFEFLWQHVVILLIFDAEYFAWHWLHHRVRPLYRHVHSVHHQFHSPHAWVTQYLHPYELMTIGVMSNTAPLLLGTHPLTAFSYQIMAIQLSVEVHVGYDMPFMIHRWVPFYGGSLHHDMHHQRPNTNFGPFFSWLDLVFGTFCPSQHAGGVKSAELLAWEERDKQQRLARREKSDMKRLQSSQQGSWDSAKTTKMFPLDSITSASIGRKKQEQRSSAASFFSNLSMAQYFSK